jgi:hypothetical protein
MSKIWGKLIPKAKLLEFRGLITWVCGNSDVGGKPEKGAMEERKFSA